MITIRKSRLLIWVPLFCLALLGLLSFRFGGHYWRQQQRQQRQPIPPLFTLPTNNVSNPTTNTTESQHDVALIPFWDSVSKALLNAKPPCPLPDEPIQAAVEKFANIKKGSIDRPDLIKLSQQDVDQLRDAHSHYVAQILPLAAHMPYVKGSRGIVATAQGEFLPILVVSLRMLRRTGSQLPVQVFVESRRVYEKRICEEVLPTLNATCVLLSDVWDAVPQRVEISSSRHQLKVFAMLFSPFDEMLLLDADSVATQSAEQWMNAEPFISTGFVAWPDYWTNSASPKYFEISSQPTPPVTERASSESGQLLLSKSKHASTLLLSLYYNYYGPSHYYSLLSQGGPGQGDKETYLAAATSLNSTFYTVHTPVEELGYIHDDNLFKGCGASQSNPEDDYDKHVLHDDPTITTPRRAFVHAQTYKMNAGSVPELFHSEINQRMWGPKDAMVEKFGRDLEKQLWAETLAVGCQFEKGYFGDWENRTQVCKRIGRVYKFLYD